MIEFNATILVSMISFVIFMFIMNLIFYKPILAIIQKRQEYVDSNYSKSKEMSELAQKYNLEYDSKLLDAKNTCSSSLKAELESARGEADGLIKKEKDFAKDSISEAKKTLNLQADVYKEELNNSVRDGLADLILGKIG